jgi:alpha-galactosidase
LRSGDGGGCELLVLDDGWYGKRGDTYSGLGDRSPSAEKLPHGLDGVAKDVSALGLKFGIWSEPEADPTDSNLCRLRPDWCLHVPSRARTTGRSQLVPDVSRQCGIRGNIYEHLHEVLALAHAECVKWNMSRRLSAACVQDWDARRQGEVRRGYALGAYRVFHGSPRHFGWAVRAVF